MKKDEENNIYTIEEILEYLYNMCTRCKNKDNEKLKNQIRCYREKLLIIKNHRMDRLSEELGIKF